MQMLIHVTVNPVWAPEPPVSWIHLLISALYRTLDCLPNNFLFLQLQLFFCLFLSSYLFIFFSFENRPTPFTDQMRLNLVFRMSRFILHVCYQCLIVYVVVVLYLYQFAFTVYYCGCFFASISFSQ